MATTPGYGRPPQPTRNPFIDTRNFPQPRREGEANPHDPYGSTNRLPSNSGYDSGTTFPAIYSLTVLTCHA
jgi:hypothetical protein